MKAVNHNNRNTQQIRMATPATIHIITKKTYEEKLKADVGSLLFPDNLWSCLHYIDEKKLKKTLKDRLPEKAKIIGVIIHTDSSPLFRNVANKEIHYKHALCIDESADGAYKKMDYGMERWVSDHPIGDAFVVIN